MDNEWKPGDAYWCLWLQADTGHYVPRREGMVVAVDGEVVRLAGTWRYQWEPLAFRTRSDAQAFAAGLALGTERFDAVDEGVRSHALIEADDERFWAAKAIVARPPGACPRTTAVARGRSVRSSPTHRRIPKERSSRPA